MVWPNNKREKVKEQFGHNVLCTGHTEHSNWQRLTKLTWIMLPQSLQTVGAYLSMTQKPRILNEKGQEEIASQCEGFYQINQRQSFYHQNKNTGDKEGRYCCRIQQAVPFQLSFYTSGGSCMALITLRDDAGQNQIYIKAFRTYSQMTDFLSGTGSL